MKNDKNFDVKKLKAEELCEEMKKMTPDQRVAYVKKKTAEREALQKKIGELATKRQQYINEQIKKNPSAADKAFDAALAAPFAGKRRRKGSRFRSNKDCAACGFALGAKPQAAKLIS